MAKITTRATEEDVARESLRAILSRVTNGKLGGKMSQVNAGDTLDEVLETTENLLAGSKSVIEKLAEDLRQAHYEAHGLAVRLEDCVNIIEEFLNVEYDHALDQATADMMDALCASGAADATADGELAWDERITMSKGDLKPILREAIRRWVDLKAR